MSHYHTESSNSLRDFIEAASKQSDTVKVGAKPIENHMDQLARILLDLNGAVSELAKRLEPVLGPETEAAGGPSGGITHQADVCAIARRLHEMAGSAHGSMSLVNHIIRRLEV